MPDVTVVTAVHNGAEHLAATIASIQAQGLADWEYLIVDDASTDGTAALIAEHARRDPRIRLIPRAARGGPFAAANDGVRQAAGRYIVRTDADDVSLPTRLACQLTFLREHPSARACASYAQGLDASGPMPGEYYTPPLTSGSLKWYLCLRCPLVHSSACVERAALLQIGGYRELPLAQDLRLWCDLARAGWLAVVPEVLVYFRRHERRVSLAHTEEQKALGKAVVRENVTALTGRDWSPAEADALYAVGHAESFAIPAALEALDHWDRAWAADDHLTPSERAELQALSSFRRRKFLRSNARRQPAGFLRHMHQFLFPEPARRRASVG